MPIYPTEGADAKCEDCKLLCDHITKLDAWVLKWSDSIAKIPTLCKTIDELKQWVATWPEEHMGFARSEIEKDEKWKRSMEKQIADVQKQLQKDLFNSERNLLTRFNIILGGVAVSAFGVVVLACFQVLSYLATK